MSDFKHRMSRRADHSVIECKSQALLVGDMSIDYVGRKRIAFTKPCE